jgi:hypothetical protein
MRGLRDVLWGADLRGMPGIEYDTAVGHHHRLLPVMGDVHGGDAGLLLERLDPVAYFLADQRPSAGP